MLRSAQPGCFNWRAGLPLKPLQPIRAGTRAAPANPGARLLPSLWVASAGRLPAEPSSALTSVRPRPLSARAGSHLSPRWRHQESVPTPFSFKGQGAEGGAGGRPGDPFRSKGRVIKQEGGGIFRELGPKINAEQCSPCHPRPGGCGQGGAEAGGLLQRWLGLTFPNLGKVLGHQRGEEGAKG